MSWRFPQPTCTFKEQWLGINTVFTVVGGVGGAGGHGKAAWRHHMFDGKHLSPFLTASNPTVKLHKRGEGVMQTQTDRERERVEVRERKKANAIPASLSHFLASRPLLPVLHYSHVNTPLAPPRWHAAQLLRPSPSLVLLTLLWTGETAVLRHTALALQICVSGQQ